MNQTEAYGHTFYWEESDGGDKVTIYNDEMQKIVTMAGQWDNLFIIRFAELLDAYLSGISHGIEIGELGIAGEFRNLLRI